MVIGKLLRLEDGGFCRVNAADYDWLRQWKWKRADRGGYPIRTKDSRSMHRLLLELEVGDRRQGDHKNGNVLDNRRDNLRIVTYAQNRQNEKPRKTYAGKAPKSKYRGVFYRSAAFIAKRPNGKHWFVKHRLDGRECFGGSFNTEEEANEAAIEWRKENMPFAVN